MAQSVSRSFSPSDLIALVHPPEVNWQCVYRSHQPSNLQYKKGARQK